MNEAISLCGEEQFGPNDDQGCYFKSSTGQQEIILRGNTLGKRIICICGLAFLILVFPAVELPASSSNADILRQRIGQILSLREKISKKQIQAIEIRENLRGQTAELREEMIDDHKQLKTTSYQEAIRTPRIFYDLLLSQQLHAYISKLNEKIEKCADGNAKLEFLYLRADDDLKIVETLNHMTVERLMAQIDKTLIEYISIPDEYLIDANDIVLKKPVEIWNEIIQQK